MRPEWWGYIVDVAQILSAIGTCGAVIVALYIAKSPPKLHFSGYVGLRILIGGNVPKELKPEYVNVTVTNTGANEFIIQSFGWYMGRRSKLAGLQMMRFGDEYIQSDVTPKRMQHGESASYYLAAFGKDNWFAKISEENDLFRRGFADRKSLQNLRLHVYTTVGVVHSMKPEEGVLERIWQAIDAGNQQHGKPAMVEKRGLWESYKPW